MRPKKTALAESMPPRVRIRREAKGISGADLSRRDRGLSRPTCPSIEKGIRVPDIPVAVRIAHVLEDDEALYVAWCRDHKARSRSKSPSTGDDDAWTQLYRGDRFDDDALFSRAVRSGQDIPPSPRAKMVEVRSMRAASLPAMDAPLFDSTDGPPGAVEQLVESLASSARSEGRSLVTAPVLEAGKDPGERDEVPRQLWVDKMVIDPRFLPDARLGRPLSSGPTRRCHGGSATALRRATSSSCRATWRTGRRCRAGCTRCGRAAGSSWGDSRATGTSSSSSRDPRTARWSTSDSGWGSRQAGAGRGSDGGGEGG